MMLFEISIIYYKISIINKKHYILNTKILRVIQIGHIFDVFGPYHI